MGLTQEEVIRLLTNALDLTKTGAAVAIKKIQATGTVEVFGAKSLKVHDAVRAIGLQHLELMRASLINTALLTLKEILVAGLERDRDTSRFSLLTQVFIKLDDVMTLIGLSGEEVFYEMGISVDILSRLEQAVDSGSLSPHQAFWALDGVVFSHMRSGKFDEVPGRLAQMEALLAEHEFEYREQIAWAMKKVIFASEQGNEEEVRRAIEYATPKIPDAKNRRVFEYNHAIGLWKLKRHKQAENLCRKVIDEYYEMLGLTPKDVIGKNPDVLWTVIKRPPDVDEDLKHIADALELYAITREAQGLPTPFARIHSMKFYGMIGAYDSIVRVGQDLADEFVGLKDYEGAREVMEQHVLPMVSKAKLVTRMVQCRSQYAVILAHAGEHMGAVTEIQRLRPYLDGVSESQRKEVEHQTGFIAHIINQSKRAKVRATLGSVGRNDRCPCGSGLKYKKCHGT